MSVNFKTIPAIDLLDQQVVRLRKGNYEDVQYYEKSPLEFAKLFESHGATRIHLVDLDGAKSGLPTNFDVIRSIREETSCEIEIGGGIRDIETAKKYIDLGVDFIILGSLLVKNPALAKQIITRFPNQVIAGIDSKNDQIATDGWIETSGVSTLELINQFASLPIESVIVTDIDTDGMLSGPNVHFLDKISANSSIPVIASGGVSCAEDINQLKSLNKLYGCIVGKAILSELIPLKSLWKN